MTEQSRRSLLIVFIAFISSTLIYLFLGFLMGKTSQTPRMMAGNYQTLFILFVVLSLAEVVIVWLLRKKAYSELSSPGSLQALEEQLRGKHIILFALSEVPAIYGILYFFLTGHFAGQFMLTLFSWICLGISKPSTKAIEEMERRFGF